MDEATRYMLYTLSNSWTHFSLSKIVYNNNLYIQVFIHKKSLRLIRGWKAILCSIFCIFCDLAMTVLMLNSPCCIIHNISISRWIIVNTKTLYDGNNCSCTYYIIIFIYSFYERKILGRWYNREKLLIMYLITKIFH